MQTQFVSLTKKLFILLLSQNHLLTNLIGAVVVAVAIIATLFSSKTKIISPPWATLLRLVFLVPTEPL